MHTAQQVLAARCNQKDLMFEWNEVSCSEMYQEAKLNKNKLPNLANTLVAQRNDDPLQYYTFSICNDCVIVGLLDLLMPDENQQQVVFFNQITYNHEVLNDECTCIIFCINLLVHLPLGKYKNCIFSVISNSETNLYYLFIIHQPKIGYYKSKPSIIIFDANTNSLSLCKCKPLSSMVHTQLQLLTGGFTSLISVSALLIDEQCCMLCSYERASTSDFIHTWMQLDLNSLAFVFPCSTFACKSEVYAMNKMPKYQATGFSPLSTRTDMFVSYRPYLMYYDGKIFVFPGPHVKISEQQLLGSISYYDLQDGTWQKLAPEHESEMQESEWHKEASQNMKRGCYCYCAPICASGEYWLVYTGQHFVLFDAKCLKFKFIYDGNIEYPTRFTPPTILSPFCASCDPELVPVIYIAQFGYVSLFMPVMKQIVWCGKYLRN